jgi:hypothetical protein
VTRRWPGWEDDPAGVEIAPIAKWAADNGHEYGGVSAVCGPYGAHQWVDRFWFRVTPSGEVSMPTAEDDTSAGWEPVIEDGRIKGVRCLAQPDLPVFTTVRVPKIVMPAEELLSPALLAFTPLEGDSAVVGGDILNAIDASLEENGTMSAALYIMTCGEDGQVTNVGWPMTPESAASVLEIIRKRHGEPVAEFLTDVDKMHAGHREIMKRDLGVYYGPGVCTCEDVDGGSDA